MSARTLHSHGQQHQHTNVGALVLRLLVLLAATYASHAAEGLHRPMDPLEAYYRGIIRKPIEEGRELASSPAPVNGLPWQLKAWGTYRQRAAVKDPALGVILHVWAYDIVKDAAVNQTVLIINKMLLNVSTQIKKSIQGYSSKVSVLGSTQKLLDIPEFRWLEKDKNGADYWNGMGGLGATTHTPVSTFKESNILELADAKGNNQGSTLVHEFGHHVMNLGLFQCVLGEIEARYNWAGNSGAYDPDVYIMTNSMEYWAVVTSAYFDADVSSYLNQGVITRKIVNRYDRPVADVLLYVYGNGTWRYPQSCVNCRVTWFTNPTRPSLLDVDQPGGPQGTGAGRQLAGTGAASDDPGSQRASSRRQLLMPNSQPQRNDPQIRPVAEDAQWGLTDVRRRMQQASATSGVPLPPWYQPIPFVCSKLGAAPPPPQDCVEQDPANCRIWAGLGYCAKDFVAYMQANCSATCNPCRCGLATVLGLSCSASGKVVAAPPPPPPVPCRDQDVSCAGWAARGECTGARSEYMRDNCKVSCKACNATCEDWNVSCVPWAVDGECTGTSAAYMLKNCRASCNACLTGRASVVCRDWNVSCPVWADRGECTGSKSGYMLKYCKASCNKCGGTGIANVTLPCQDRNVSCAAWAGRGECTGNFSAYMLQNCKASCKVCDAPSGTGNITLPCQDRNVSCVPWAVNGECTGPSAAYMLQNCRESCNACLTGRASVVCRDWNVSCAARAGRGECTGSKSGYMLKYCKSSCNKCNEFRDSMAQCRDQNPLCAAMATLGQCTRNATYMLQFCRASCKVCGISIPAVGPGSGGGAHDAHADVHAVPVRPNGVPVVDPDGNVVPPVGVPDVDVDPDGDEIVPQIEGPDVRAGRGSDVTPDGDLVPQGKIPDIVVHAHGHPDAHPGEDPDLC